jgi:hypothetical protein
MTEHIAIAEQSLIELEAVIDRGLGTFVEVGAALLTIRDERLYREAYDSFEGYCLQRWGFKRAHAYRLIEAAETIQGMSPIGDTPPPANEAQARELARIPADTRAQVWTAVVEEHGERVTAADIRRAVSEPETAPNGMLPIVDLETGEVVHPTKFRIKTDEERARERRREVTRTFAETFSLLSSLLLEDRDQIAEMWEPSANTMADVAPLAHLWSAEGIRDVARRLERLADEVDKRGGRLG